MKNKIETFLTQYNLTSSNNIIAVGFSGGFDSICLLHILLDLSKKYGFKVVAAHLNHNWREEESQKEAQNCQDFCAENNIEFYTETLDKNEKHTETRARELRYEFFNRTIKKYNANALLTAHTKSDTAETILYRISKGTGIKGLQGISPKLGKIYRPMLDISRTEIEKYCKDNQLNANNDSSNKDNHYARNFIRNEILPLFTKMNPQVEKALNSLSILAFEEEQIIHEYINSLNIYTENKIKTDVFKNLSQYMQKRIIYELFVKYDFEYNQDRIENILKFTKENFNSKSGKKCSIDAKHWLFVNNEYMEIITEQQQDISSISIKTEGEYNFLGHIFTIKKCDKMPKTYPNDNEFKAYVEINQPINFELRTRRNGDKITPLGKNQLIKLKDYLINKNIPQHKKDSIILLCKDTEILWASGLGLNNKIKVVNKCTHVLTLK